MKGVQRLDGPVSQGVQRLGVNDQPAGFGDRDAAGNQRRQHRVDLRVGPVSPCRQLGPRQPGIGFAEDRLAPATRIVQGLAADWNDCIQFGVEGESMFSTFLFANGLRIVRELAEVKGDTETAAWCEEQSRIVGKVIVPARVKVNRR